ncbi:hypothetical protein GCM10010442_25450 [Kitasatospora kifunensis]
MAKPDGNYELQTYVHPVRVKQDGNWTPVDTTLVKHADGTIAPKAAASSAVFSGGGVAPAVTLSHGDQKLAMSWPTTLPTPVLSGSSATYPSVLPGVDLQLTATSEAYTEVLVVHDAKAAADPELKDLHLGVSGTNLTVHPTDDGSLSATDGQGQEVYRSSPAMMWDSTDEPKEGPKPTATDPGSGHLSKLDVSTSGSPGATAAPQPSEAAPAPTPSPSPAAAQTTDVKLAAPDAALKGPDVRYPLYIDPWFAPGPGASSTYWVSVSNKGYNTYNVSTQDARAGYCGWTGCNYDILRSYFNMNVSGIQARNGVKANLTSARFYLTQTHDGACSSQPTDLNESGWVDGNTSWPGPLGRQLDQQSSDAGGNSDCPKNSGDLNFDASSGVQDAINGNWSILTLGVHADNENDANQWKRFGNNPHLDIDYNYPPTPATNVSVSGEFACNGVNYVTNNTNFTVNAQAWDQNPNPLPLRYWFEVWNDSSKLSWNWNYAPVQTSSGAVGSWQSNYGTYPNGNYRVRATVENVPQSDPAPPVWANTGASGDNDGNYNGSIGNAALHGFTVLNETMPSPKVASYDFQTDQSGNPVWGLPQGTGGQFELSNNGNSNTAGYSYAIDSGGSVDGLTNGTCNYSSQRTAGGAVYGMIPDSGGSAALALPSGLSVGHHTLWVKSFDAAHNMSPSATAYEFFISPNYNVPQVKYEAEDSKSVTLATSAPKGVATAPTTSVQSWGPQVWSGGSQVMFLGSEPGDQYKMTFNTTLDADYALGLRLTKSTDYGMLQADLDGTVLGDTGTSPFNGYTSTCCSTAFLSLGGARLTPGPHTLTLTVTGTDPGTATSASHGRYWAGVDYISAIPINNAAYANFSSAMNNHGISDDANPGSANLDLSARNPSGDAGSTTGTGNSLSKQAMSSAGLGAGNSFTTSGINFTMPTPNGSGNDNVVAMGQTITLDPAQQVPANAVGLLVASVCGTAPTSSATLTYTAGPAPDKPITSPVPDWVTGTAQTAAYTLQHVNTPSGTGNPGRLYLLVLPANPAATVQSITLPNYGTTLVPGTCPNALHVLAIGVRPAASANAPSSTDTSGANHPLAEIGNVGFSTDHGSSAATGGSALFDGTGGALATSTPVLDTSKSYTVSAWVKPTNLAGGYTLISQSGTTACAFQLYYSSWGHAWAFGVNPSDTNGVATTAIYGPTTGANAPQAGVWAHLVGVYDATAKTIQLYVNGAPAASAPYTGTVWNATAGLQLGRHLSAGSYSDYASALISDVQVYQRALTAADANTLAGYAAPTALATPAGSWPLADFGRSWIGAWASVPTSGTTTSGSNTFVGQTLRQTVHPSTLGSGTDAKVRIRLNNRFDTAPATVTAATVALAGAAGPAATGTTVPLTFGGRTSVTILPGAEVFSDPVAVSALGGNGDLSLSLYFANGVTAAPTSPQANVVGYLAGGDQTASTGTGTTWTPGLNGWYFVSGVDVTSTDTTQGTVAVLGDQNALGSAAGVTSWADKLPTALSTAGVVSPGGIVNLSNKSTTASGVANSLGQRLHNWWRLSDGSGTTAADLTGNAPITFSGGTSWNADHPASTSGSVYVDGSTGAGATNNTPGVDTTKSFTVSVWAKPTAVGGAIVAQKDTNASGFMIWPDGSSSTWRFALNKSDDGGWNYDVAAGTTPVALNTWTHLTATYNANGGSMALYVNGQLAATGWHTATVPSNGSLLIGDYQYQGAPSAFFKGNIADVEVFREALPAGDVAVLAAGGGSDLQAGNLLNASALDEPNLRTVVLALGANDLAHGDTAATIEANLTSLVTDIKTGLKQYKGPDGTFQIHVIVTTVPSMGWAANDPREQARTALNSDLSNNKIGAVDGVEDVAKASAGAGSTDPNVINSAIANQFAADAQSYVISL